MPQSSWPSSSPFALLPPPRFEGLEECVGCRPVPLDRPARRARAQPHDILRPSLPPTVRCVATLPLLLVPGNCGVRRGWRWRARPALRARRGADRAQADGRVHHAAGGRHSSPPKSPGAFHARSLALTRTVVLGRTRAARSRSSPSWTATERKPAWLRPSLHPLPSEPPKRRTPYPLTLSSYHPITLTLRLTLSAAPTLRLPLRSARPHQDEAARTATDATPVSPQVEGLTPSPALTLALAVALAPDLTLTLPLAPTRRSA